VEANEKKLTSFDELSSVLQSVLRLVMMMMLLLLLMMTYLRCSTLPDIDTPPPLTDRAADHVTMTSPMTSARRRPPSNGIGRKDRAT